MLATLFLITFLASLCEAQTNLPTLLRASSVFEYGTFSTIKIPVDKSESTNFTMLIVSPTVGGNYPVIQFHHGFEINCSDYSDLFEFVSSHGYIVVAPQLYRVDSLLPSSGPTELNSAAEVSNWLLSGLSSEVPEDVQPDLTKVIISGHSRGGKVAFALALALALGKASTQLQIQFSAVFGVDPVEGTDPNILTKEPNSFDLQIPVGVIGTGLGSQWNLLIPPCAPDGSNHKEFFNECKPSCEHFVTTDYGHMDMLNDEITGVIANLAVISCKSGPKSNKDALRRSIGGIFVAFLKAHLYNNWDYLDTIIADPANVAPVPLDDPVEVKPLNEAFVV